MKRRAFTLVELLVTITIIGILAAMVSGALIVARNSGREAATKATIAKLNQAVSAKFESFNGSRRLPMSDDDKAWVAVNRLGWPSGTPLTTTISARVTLCARRDLMRMEMPDRTADIQDPPRFFPPSFIGTGQYLAYRIKYLDLDGNPRRPGAHPSAQMLFMIVNGSPETYEQRLRFGDAEKADTDGDDRADVFVDGWGQPIYWIRWAPGFNDSDLQGGDPLADHDPLDTRRTDSVSFRLYPLVYSAGPDGEYGLWQDTVDPDPKYHWTGNVYATIHDSKLGRDVRIGEPLGDTHYDNIHNHRGDSY